MGIREKASHGMHEIKEESKVIRGEKSKDKTYSSSKEFADHESAKAEFESSIKKLFDVNAWTAIPGAANAAFGLFTQEGKPLSRNYVENGDFIKIDLPGPLPFYWVKVTELSKEENSAQFTVQPSYDPTSKKADKTVTDHFFQDQARSIFRVEQNGRELTAMEIGINESINNQGAEAGEKGLLNTLVSEVGWAVIQKYQWKNLTDFLVGNK